MSMSGTKIKLMSAIVHDSKFSVSYRLFENINKIFVFVQTLELTAIPKNRMVC